MTTSGSSPEHSRTGPLSALPDEWRRFFAFVRHPMLPPRAVGFGLVPAARTAIMLGLDLAAMALLLTIAVAVSKLFGELPSNALNNLEIGIRWLLIIVIGGPVSEELIFRSWLSGRPGHLQAIGCIIAALVVAVAAMRVIGGLPGSLIAVVCLLTGLGVGIAFAVRGRKRAAWAWFQRHFRWFYLASTICFALSHLANYQAGNAAMLLPLVIPQFVTGLMLGYVRVNYGLWASIALHAAHNALFIGMALLFGQM